MCFVKEYGMFETMNLEANKAINRSVQQLDKKTTTLC